MDGGIGVGASHPHESAKVAAGASPAATAPAAPRAGGRRSAVVLAAAALIVALGALGVSALALARSDRTAAAGTAAATTPARRLPSGQAAATPPAAISPASQAAEPTPTVSAGEINPSATFETVYQAQKLTIEGVCENNNTKVGNIDIDEPRVGADQARSELQYTNCSSPGYALGYAGPALHIARIGSATASPNDCADALRTAPIGLPIAPSQGLSLCIETDAAQAQSEGISQKLALLTVNSIASDGTLAVTLTTWQVPA